MRPWQHYPILECSETLEKLPGSLHCIEPHPYYSIGAPYGGGLDPFCLRKSVIGFLLRAQEELQSISPNLKLAIFDAWRPIPVQSFMVDYVIRQQCLAKGLDRCNPDDALEVESVVESVYRFWAEPSYEPNTPPPHSTGGAVDLTLANKEGGILDMGGEIDAISKVSEPDYYLEKSKSDSKSQSYLWHERRSLLAGVMKKAGFVQHPNEWWHFSYGDQMWAWTNHNENAIYGAWASV